MYKVKAFALYGIIGIVSIFLVFSGLNFILPGEPHKEGNITKAEMELLSDIYIPPEPKYDPSNFEEIKNNTFTNLSIQNISKNCDGIIEDGICISKNETNISQTTEEKSFSSISSENEIVDEYKPPKKGNNVENKTQPTVSYEDILRNVPDSLKNEAEIFLGDEKVYNSIVKGIEDAEQNNSDVKEKIEKIKDLIEKNGVKGLFSIPKIKDISFAIGKKTTSAGKAYSIVEGGFEKTFNFAGFLVSGGDVYISDYKDKNEVRIEKISVKEKDGIAYIRIYFPSYLSMYTYTAITPITLKIDYNNDGVGDFILKPLENDMDKYEIYNRISRQREIKNLNYDLDEKYIEFESPVQEGSQRFWFWIYESSTRLRYPTKNSLYYSFLSHSLIENTIDYMVIILEEVKLKDDGDWFFNGEGYLHNYVVLSKNIEDMVNDSTKQYLEDMRRRGVLKENEVPDWLAYYILREYWDRNDLIGRAYMETSTFPMLKWWSINDGAIIMRGDWTFGRRAIPIFVGYEYDVETFPVFLFAVNAYDDDTIGTVARDITKWGLLGIVQSATGGAAGFLAKKIISLMYYKVSGNWEDVDDIFGEVVDAFYNWLGRPDKIGGIKSRDKNILHEGTYYFRNNKMEVKVKVEKVKVPVVPMNILVKVNNVKVKDRGDYLKGEYYFYARACTSYQMYGYGRMTGGRSFSYPARKEGPCEPDRKLKHRHVSVWNGDKVAKNVEIINEQNVRGAPFVYFELSSWDEDNEKIGDNDDNLGIFNIYIPLDEDTFSWTIDENIPIYNLEETVNLGKTELSFVIDIN